MVPKTMKKPNSLMVQLSVAVVLISTLVLAVFGSYRYMKNSTILRDQLEQTLDLTVKRLATGLATPFYEYYDAGIKNNIYSEMKNNEVIGVYLFGLGEKVPQYGYIRLENKIIESCEMDVPKWGLKRSEKIVHEGEILGEVHVIMTTKHMENQLKELIISDIFQIIIIDFFIAVLMIFVLKIKFIRPITRLTQNTLEIKNGNLDQPLNIQGKDEIGILAKSFMHMRDSIKEKIVKLNDEIEDRIKAEEALLHFKSAVEASSDAIGMSTPEGRHWYQNKMFEDLFGQTGEDLSATLYSNESVGRDVFRSIIKGVPWTGEVEMNGKDGNKILILLRAYAVKDNEGIISGLVGVYTDITEHKKAEEDLRRSEQRFRELAELLPQTVFELDLDGRLTFLNRYAYKVFGYDREDFRDGLNGVDLIIPIEREKIRATLKSMLQNSVASMYEPYTALRKNRTTFPVVIYISVIRDDKGPAGYRGIIVDIAEQVKLKEEKSRLEEQYYHAQKMEAVGRLAGGVAHDLNNMLSPILGYSELLYIDFNQDDPRRKSADGIRQAGLRARDLVRQLLTFGRKQTIEIKAVDLNRVILNFEKLLQRTIREDIDIKVTLSPSIPAIMADVGQVEQLIMNLAVNAQDAMPGGGYLTIETAETIFDEADMMDHHGIHTGSYVQLTISDNGMGMDEDTRERIFEPFFTTKGKDKGTGLGLSTVYGIVKQHGGHIWVYSEPDQGTIFKIYLPVTKREVVTVDKEVEDLSDLRGNETILVVEDDQMVRDMTQAILINQGYTVLTASSGKEALRILDAHTDPLHLLLTDVILPEMNGRELFEHAAGKCPGLIVLYMSGYADNVLAPHGILEEGLNFIQKPFSVQALALKLRETLDKDRG